MGFSAEVAWVVGMIPSAMALYWAHKRWRYDDSPETSKYFRKFLLWGAIAVAFWAVGVALDMRNDPPMNKVDRANS
jgi:hypothetical protein